MHLPQVQVVEQGGLVAECSRDKTLFASLVYSEKAASAWPTFADPLQNAAFLQLQLPLLICDKYTKSLATDKSDNTGLYKKHLPLLFKTSIERVIRNCMCKLVTYLLKATSYLVPSVYYVLRKVA